MNESAWFQPWNLTGDILVSKFAFKCNLYRCTQDEAQAAKGKELLEASIAAEGLTVLGWREVPVDKSVVGRMVRPYSGTVRAKTFSFCRKSRKSLGLASGSTGRITDT